MRSVPIEWAAQISDTKAGDNECVPTLVEEAQDNLPEGRIQTLAYDKAADDGKVHQMLHEAGISPVIQNRACWPADGEQEKASAVGSRYTWFTTKPEPCTATTPSVRHRCVGR